MKAVVDLIIVGLVLGLTYALTSEGLWGAALMFFNVLFSGMIAFNFYEPLATLLDSTGIPWGFSDTLCLLGLFCISLMVFRFATSFLAPAPVRFPMPLFHPGRFIFGLGGAAITIAVILLGFHTAPVYKKIFGVIDYDSKPPFGLGLDHQFLGLFQRETGTTFANYGKGQRDPYGQYGVSGGGQRFRVNVFDPKAEWLINHQNARPYGTETVPAVEAPAAKSAEGEKPPGG